MKPTKNSDKNEKIPCLKGNEEFTKKFSRSFNKETDRGAAILAATILDDSLQQLLRKSILIVHDANGEKERLIKGLFEFRGSFDSFSSKIGISFILGLVDKEMHQALHIVRKIRNVFAHEHGSSFDEENILPKLKRLGEILFPKIEKSEVEGFLSELTYIIYVSAERERLNGSRHYFDHCISSMQAHLVREIEDLNIQLGDFNDSVIALLKNRQI
jgi:hypothetical protein